MNLASKKFDPQKPRAGQGYAYYSRQKYLQEAGIGEHVQMGICSNHLLGKCKNGKSCKLLHPSSEKRERAAAAAGDAERQTAEAAVDEQWQTAEAGVDSAPATHSVWTGLKAGESVAGGETIQNIPKYTTSHLKYS